MIKSAPHRHHETIGSTNDTAILEYLAGSVAPFWITSDRQTAGKGRQGRHWQSPAGTLSATLLLSDVAPTSNLPQLAFVTSLAMAEAIEAETVLQLVALKWPNDILIDGAKVCGILLETRQSGPDQCVAIGTGVNCQNEPHDVPYAVTSLREHGFTVAPLSLFHRYQQTIEKWLLIWDQGNGFAPVRHAWLERAHGLGHQITVTQPGVGLVEGRFDGLDAEGRLCLTTNKTSETLVISAGDVLFAAMKENG
jgi:BirA family biotin operon repressor/biotin-[acetyl-CoA-carboxylase] ligase